MSYSLNDKFSIDTKTSSAKLDGNLEIRNYLSYKTNNDTVNLNASIVPNTYDIYSVGGMNATSNVLTGNIVFGNPYQQVIETRSLSNVDCVFEFHNTGVTNIQVSVIGSNITVAPDKSIHKLVTFSEDGLSFFVQKNIDVTYIPPTEQYRTYCTKVQTSVSPYVFLLYCTRKLPFINSYYSTLRRYNTVNPLEEVFLRINTFDISGSVVRITDIAIVSTTEVIITGFYRLDTYFAALECSTSAQPINDVLLNTNFQTNIFIMSINLSTFRINWAKYIVGVQNVYLPNLDAKILLTENKTKVVCATYMHTENQRVSVYKRVVTAEVVSYVLDQDDQGKQISVLGTDQNATNEFVLLKCDVSTGKVERTSRIIPTYLENNEYNGDPDIASFYELTAMENGDFSIYIKNNATVPVTYRTINYDGSYRLGIDYKNILIYYNISLNSQWNTNIISTNSLTRYTLGTIDHNKILLKTVNPSSSNIDIYNFDNSIYTSIIKDTNYYGNSASIIYNNDGTVYNASYIKYKSSENRYSIGAASYTNYISAIKNSTDLNYLYVDSFTNEKTQLVQPYTHSVHLSKLNQTSPYKLFKVGNQLDKTIIDADLLYVSGDLKLGGKVSSDFFLNEDNSKIRNNLQIKSRRLVHQVVGAAASNFSFLYEGVYKIEPSDVELFLNGYKLCYQDDTHYDYTVAYDTYQTSNTIFTITLADNAKYGDILDITIWPSYLSSNAVMQPGYVLQTISTDFFRQGDQTIYHIGAVGIGTTFSEKTLSVEGGISITDKLYFREGTTYRPFQESPFIPIIDDITNNYYLPENTTIGIGTNYPLAALHLKDRNILVDGSGKISTGNLGVGTTIPIQPLHIEKKTYLNASLGIGTTIARQDVDLHQRNMIVVGGNIGIGTTIPLVGFHNVSQSAFIGNVGIGTLLPRKPLDISGDVILSGNIGIGTTTTSIGKVVVHGGIIPTTNTTFDIGTSSLRFRDIYLSGNTIDLGGTKISRDNITGGIQVTTTNGVDVDMKAASLFASGNVGVGTTVARQKVDIQGGNVVISGNLGVGITNPVQKVDVNGIVQAMFFKGNGSLLTDLPVGQWTIDGTKMYYTSGNVGIGTSSPVAPMDVYGGAVLRNGNIGIGTAIARNPLDIYVSPYVTVPADGYLANLNAKFENSRYPPSGLTFSSTQTSNLPGLEVVYPADYLTANTTTVNTALYTTGIGTYIASASSTQSTYIAYYPFRTQTSTTSWRSANSKYDSATGDCVVSGATVTTAGGTSYLGEYVQLKCPNAFILTRYELKKTSNTNAYLFYLFASTDGTTWTLLDTQTISWSGTLSVTIPSPTVSASYYRIVVNKVNNSTTYAEIGLWSLFGKDTISGIPVKESGTYSSTTYSYNQGLYIVGINNGYALDYHTTRPITTSSFTSRVTGLLNSSSSITFTSSSIFTNTNDVSTPVYISITVPAKYGITKYDIKGPSTTSYAPNKWRLYGSTNNTTWTLLDTRTGITFTASETKTFTFASETLTYTYYIFEFLRNNSVSLSPISFQKIYLYGPNNKSVLQITHNGDVSTNPEVTVKAIGTVTATTVQPTTLDLGYVSQTREINAGKLVYQGFSTGLDIVGAGDTVGYRTVQLWDNVNVSGIVNAYGFTRSGSIRFADQHTGSATSRHMAFIRNGDLFTVGYNGYGQLGTGRVDNNPLLPRRVHWLPVNITLQEKVISVKVTYLNTIFLTTDTNGTNYIYTIGDGTSGQIGDSNTVDKQLPTLISQNSDLTPVIQPVFINVSYGYSQGTNNNSGKTMLYINSAGELYIWGIRPDNAGSGTYTRPTKLNPPPNGGIWKGAVTDGYSIQAWTDDLSGNALYAMGYNTRGALANGTTTNSIGTWVACLYNDGATGSQITNVSNVIIGGGAIGVSTYYARTTLGKLYAWGQNNLGSVGNGTTTTPVTLAYQVDAGFPWSVVDVVAGGAQTGNGNICVTILTSYGELYAWGASLDGYGLGNTTTYSSPQLVSLGAGSGTPVKLSGGGNYPVYFYIDDSGKVYGTGRNSGGILGTGNASASQPSYVRTILQEPCIDIYVSMWNNATTPYGNAYFQGASGRIYATGDNTLHQCDPSTSDAYVPTEVVIPL